LLLVWAALASSVDVYSDDEDEGKIYEGSTSADGAGDWTNTMCPLYAALAHPTP